jgi:voltage-gated potassium channel
MTQATTRYGRLTQASWRRYTDIPLTAAAAVFLAIYAWEVIGDLQPSSEVILDPILWAIWGLFVVDYITNLIIAERRGHWFLTHIYELFIVALPALRPLRLLRLVTLLAYLQRGAGRALRGKVVIYAAGGSLILVFVAALAELDVERHAVGSHIHNFGDSLWWAVVTITSVGYGDVTPVTIEGRFIAVGVMIAGIALLGTVTATLASFFIDRVAATTEEETDETLAAIASLNAEIKALRSQLQPNSTDTSATRTK